MPGPKRHHYLSQFYLAGFTSTGKKDGDLYAFNIEKRKVRKSNVREEGHEKYFNRIQAEGFDENYLENELSKFESKASDVLKKIIKDRRLPSIEQDWQ